jgi:transcriptional regulator with XRE-family HTH domain
VKGTIGHDDDYLPAPAGKLTDAKVREIRLRYEDGLSDVTQRELAAEFGVSPSAISDIVAGKTWRWLA